MRPAADTAVPISVEPSTGVQRLPPRPAAAPVGPSLPDQTDSLKRELDETRRALEALQRQLEDAHRDLAAGDQQQAETQGELATARGDLEATRDALEAARSQLEQDRAHLQSLLESLARARADVHQLVGSLEKTAVRLRAVAKTAPYRLAHLLRRIGMDVITGSRRDRNAALRWLRRRLVGRQTPQEQAKNPLLDEVAALWRAQETLAGLTDEIRRISSDAETPQLSTPASDARPTERGHTFRSTVGGTRSHSKRLWGRSALNPYEYLFDRYRRSRDRLFPISWQRVSVPFEPKLVSIVVPSYNGTDFIREALDSILSQTYAHLEVIAIDDGSTDTTGAILDAYARQDPRVTVVHQENQQLPRTLSRGFQLARGEFLTWTSADNRLKPTCIEKLVDALQRHPDWDMLYANYDIIGERGEPLRDTKWLDAYQAPRGSEHIRLPRDTAELNVWPNNYIGGAFLYRARVAWALGDYSPARVLMEDYDYWMRVNELMTLRHADFEDCVYEYRVHGGSLTSKDHELGITRNRTKLMVFDDFRRSFHLSKTLWVVTADGSAPAKQLAEALEARVRRAEHVLMSAEEMAEMALPRLWMPTAWVHVGAGSVRPPQRPPIGDLAAKILVSTAGPLELPPSADWDTLISTGRARGNALPRVGSGYAGWWSVGDVGDLFTLCDLRAKNRQLAEIELQANTRTDRLAASAPKVSVVIGATPGSVALQRTLRAVAGQTLARSQYEVIVVNTAPHDPFARHAVAQIRAECFGDTPDQIRLVDCPFPGLPHAQNAGLSDARGEYVVFLGQNTTPSAQCLEWFLRGFEEHPNAGVIGGHVRLQVPTPRPPACPAGREALWHQFLTAHTGYVEATEWWEYPYPDNWAARRRALVEIGGIRCNWGHTGADFTAGQEIAAASLVRQLGHDVAIEPRAQAVHAVDLDGYTETYAAKAIYAGITAHYRLQQCLYLPRRSLSGLWRDLKRASLSALRDRTNGRCERETENSLVNKRYDREIFRARLAVFRLAMGDLVRRSRRAVTNG